MSDVTRLELFLENKELLKQRRKNAVRATMARIRASRAKTNFKSIKSMVASELDNSGLSKAVLKDVIAGDQRVIKAEGRVDGYKNSYSARQEMVDFIQEEINNNKKMMDCINIDVRNFGG